MYNRPYKIKDLAFFKKITALADFYFALPILSSSLGRALLDSELFCESIRANSSVHPSN